MGKSETQLCKQCKQEIETVEHLFCYCKHTTKLWQMVEKNLLTHIDIKISKYNILFGIYKQKHDLGNLIISHVKLQISKAWKKNITPKYEQIKAAIDEIYYTEKKIAKSKNQTEAFELKWKKYIKL